MFYFYVEEVLDAMIFQLDFVIRGKFRVLLDQDFLKLCKVFKVFFRSGGGGGVGGKYYKVNFIQKR